jgi:site-specific DNA-adenine methylase
MNKINNNNKTNTKHEFNVKYERYKQDISNDTLQMQKKKKAKIVKKPTFLRKHVSMTLLEVSPSCLHFSLMFSEGEVESPYFLQVW